MCESKACVSIILPVHNAASWLDECLQSVLQQTFAGSVQLSVYNDASTDGSEAILKSWQTRLEKRGVQVIMSGNIAHKPKGVGFAKNRAVEQSTGYFLCFLDADDVMSERRLEAQYQAAQSRPHTLIGSQFSRQPEGSTLRYTKWANSLTPEQLYTQRFTSHGPTVIMPTWFCSRDTHDLVGGFDESGQGTPEDLIFFYKHIQLGGKLHRVEEDLLMYRYHPAATTFSVTEETIWQIRVIEIQKQVIENWSKFTIWNAGKQGRQLYRSLSLENQKKVSMFCDVDEKKIRKGFYTYEESQEVPRPKIPVVHFRASHPPYIICVKQDLTGGEFEKNLLSLSLTEGVDYFHFN